MKNLYHYALGMIIWSAFSTLVLFGLIAIASMEITKTYICIDTTKMVLLILLTNMLLTAMLIKLNQSN
jgi:hypothetical protein